MSLHDELSEVEEGDQLNRDAEFVTADSSRDESDNSVSGSRCVEIGETRQRCLNRSTSVQTLLSSLYRKKIST